MFVGVMSLQTKLVVRCEERNKRAREDVARRCYDVRCGFFRFFFSMS